MLRKVLFRTLVVAALLLVAVFPAVAAFPADRIGPDCYGASSGVSSKTLPIAREAVELSSITIQPQSLPSGTSVDQLDIVVKVRCVDPTHLVLWLTHNQGAVMIWDHEPGKVAADLTFTIAKNIKAYFGDANGPWTLWGYAVPGPACDPQLDWWSLEVDYHYACLSFSGQVFDGAVGDTSKPLAGVEVQLYRNSNIGDYPGEWLDKTSTDANGGFFFSTGWAGPADWLAVVVAPPAGYHAAGVSCPADWQKGPNAANLPYNPGNFTGLKFFVQANPVIPPPDANTAEFLATADTWIGESAKPTAKHGAEGSLRIRTGGAEASLLMFDVSSIPTGATVSKATLVLNANYRSNPNAMKVGAFKVLRSWTEDATWTKTGSGDWAAAGAFDATDRELTPVGTGKVGKAGSAITIDVTDLVKAWVADPTSNLGVYLAGISDSSTEVSVDSSESIYEAARPVLQVVYS